MELQKLSDINMPGSKQGRLDSRAAEASETADSQQTSAFDDQLNKQIDQSRMSESEENKHNNQYDSASESGQAATEGNAAESGMLTEETVEDEQITEFSLTESALQTGELSTQLIDVEPVMQGSESATELPDSGKTLPLSLLNSGNTNSPQQAQVSTEFANKQLTDVNIKQATLSTIKQAQNQQQFKEASIKGVAGLNASSVSADLMPLKPTIMNERLSIQNAHMNASMSELPAMDMITQASRLQQVPVSTSISSSSPGAQNINVLTAGAMVDSAATFSQLSPVGNSLSSSISASIQSPQWGQQMTEQVSVMLRGGVQQAEIKLNPANLGPMEIKLSLNDDQASVSFVAQHAPVRDALDAALPRLREMLEEQGLNLADVDVSTQDEQQQAEDQEASDEVSFDGRETSDTEELSDNTDVLQDASEMVLSMQHSKAINIFA